MEWRTNYGGGCGDGEHGGCSVSELLGGQSGLGKVDVEAPAGDGEGGESLVGGSERCGTGGKGGRCGVEMLEWMGEEAVEPGDDLLDKHPSTPLHGDVPCIDEFEFAYPNDRMSLLGTSHLNNHIP